MIPSQLQKEEYRFNRLQEKSKEPIKGVGWKGGVPHNDPQLIKHLEDGKNYGVIGGHGDLVILDADDKKLGEKLIKQLKTFAVQTCGGSYHFYFICPEIKKNVVVAKVGEIRVKNYYVVGPGCFAKDEKKGHEGWYKVVNDTPIMKIKADDLVKILTPISTDEKPKEAITKKPKDTSRSGKEMGQVIKLIVKGLSKEEIFLEMEMYSKWSTSPQQYKEMTYEKAAGYVGEKKENNESDSNILELLNQKENIKQYLDQGYINRTFYYGFNLNGREAVLLSDGKILRNTLEKVKAEKGEVRFVGENEIKKQFDYSGYIGDIAPIIANETIKRFYTKKSRNHIIKPKEIYKNIRDKLLHYMDFKGKDEIADVLACWIIATYCYQLFFWFPHILINAPSQSGKSKCVFIVVQMSFRGFDIGASAGATPAQIFRTIEGNRGTLSFDEFEQSSNKNSPQSDTQKLVNQILNASATRDAYVIRTEQIEKKWKAWKFPIFCPKIVANISGINPTSLSRFIGFKWLKTTNKEKGSRKPYREEDKKQFGPIRSDCHLLILENWQTIKQIYDTLDIKELKNRTEDNWLPLFAIAKFIDNSEGEDVKAQEQLKKYLKDYSEINIETGDLTEELFRIIYDAVKNDNHPEHYRPKDIAEWDAMRGLLGAYKSPSTFIGKKLKLYGLPTTRGGGVRKYLLTKINVQAIIDMYYSTDIVTHSNTNTT